jgi:alkylated DNA repair dioxygenase AlkB
VRHALDEHTWVDHQPGWLAGSEALLDELTTHLAWQHGHRLMYDRWVDEPRLTCGFATGEGPEVVAELAGLLSDRYHVELDRVWCNLYRDGRDSVAWHGDREARHLVDPIVAIVSLGCPRTFALRPRVPPGRPTRFALGQGDLLVMGGACQHDWEHCVPKTASPVGPRLSVTFRHTKPPAGQ